jgi:hypothetical protein
MDNKSEELTRLYKEAGWHNLRYSPGMFLEGMRKTTKTSVRIVGLRADILTRDLTNKKQE